MKKEVLIAVLIGLSLGLIITYGIYRTRLALTAPPATDISTPTPTPSAEFAADILTVLHPPDGVVQTETGLVVTGTTLPRSQVVLFAGENDFITTADDSGNFSFEVQLQTGANVLVVHAIDENGVTVTEKRVVIVNPDRLKPPVSTQSGQLAPTQSEG